MRHVCVRFFVAALLLAAPTPGGPARVSENERTLRVRGAILARGIDLGTLGGPNGGIWPVHDDPKDLDATALRPERH